MDTETTSITLDIGDLRTTQRNPRKRFDEAALNALALDIQARGILQPLIVRRVDEERSLTDDVPPAPYEVVDGERRYRAAIRAGLTTVPVTVRVLTDREALECALSANGQREELHPLEEADGLLELHTIHGVAVDEIAARTGKRASFIHQRLALARLCPEAREAFLADKITTVVAQRVARLAPSFQAEAVKVFSTVRPTVPGDDGRWSSAEVGRWVQNRYHLDLSVAPFDVDSATLVPSAGACNVCPSNTGVQRVLFEDAAPGEGYDDACCTNPVCFATKRETTWSHEAAQVADGREVLTCEVSASVAPRFFGDVPRGGYAVPSMAPVEHGGKKTWKQLLGSHAPPTVIAQGPDGRPMELYEPAALKAAMKAAGVVKLTKANPAAKASEAPAKKGKYNDPKRVREPVWYDVDMIPAVETAVDEALGKLPLGDVTTWRIVAAFVATQNDPFDVCAAVGRHSDDALTRWLVKATPLDVLKFVFRLTLRRAAEVEAPASDELAATLRGIGVDVEALLAAKYAVQAPEKPLKKVAPKKAAKKAGGK